MDGDHAAGTDDGQSRSGRRLPAGLILLAVTLVAVVLAGLFVPGFGLSSGILVLVVVGMLVMHLPGLGGHKGH